MRKKIVLITGSLESGGAERFTTFLCNHLPGNRFEKVLVVCSLKDQHFEIDPTVKIINLDSPIRTSALKVIGVLRKENPDIVFSTLMAMNIIVAMVRVLFPHRLVFVLRESSILSQHLHLFKYQQTVSRLVRLLYPRFHKIVAQSKAMQNDMMENFGIPGNKIVQIYNPIAPQPLKPPTVPSPVVQLVTVGNIRKEKGHERLVRALQYLSINFQYTIVGGGVDEEINKLKQTIAALNLQDKIVLVGAQKNPFEYLSKSTLFIQGSYFEGFPNSLLEANAVGLPIVAFDSPGGTREIIEEGVNGFLVPDGDVKAMAAYIEKAVAHPFDAVAIRNNVLAKFNQEVILEKYINLFSEAGRKA